MGIFVGGISVGGMSSGSGGGASGGDGSGGPSGRGMGEISANTDFPSWTSCPIHCAMRGP